MTRHFPDWLAAYTDHTRASESPTVYHLWTGISVIAGALRRRVWLEHLNYQETPNFYIILVGPAGVVQKSTTTRLGMRILSKVPGIKFGPASVTWQKLAKNLQDALETAVYVDSDGLEARLPMSCLTCEVSELGTFFKPEDDAFTSVLISLFDGQLQDWTHGTIANDNTTIKNPWINLIACTTPSWLRANFPEQMIGGGLVSRIIFVYGETKRQLVAYPERLIQPREFIEREKQLVEDLQQIGALCGPYIFSEAAYSWGERWYQKLWNGGRPASTASDRFDAYFSRKQLMLHKLAMVLTAAKTDKLVIEPDVLIAADLLLTSIEPSMLKVFESIGLVDEAQHRQTITSFLASYGWLDSGSLFKLCHNVMSRKDFDEALRAGCQARDFLVRTKNGVHGAVLNPDRFTVSTGTKEPEAEPRPEA